MNNVKRHVPLSASLCSILIIFLSLFTSGAGAAEGQGGVSEVALVVPWHFVEKAMAQGPVIEGAQDLGALHSEAQGIPFVIPQLRLQYKTQVAPVVSHVDGTFFNTEKLSLQLSVGGFTVQKDVVQMIGGFQATVQMKAVCEPFNLSQSHAEIKTRWKWVTHETQVKGLIEALDLSWPLDQWHIDPIICQGPRGFADLVAEEIKRNLANTPVINKLIRPHFEQAANAKIETMLAKIRDLKTLPVNKTSKHFQVQLSELEVLPTRGIVFKGRLRSSQRASGDFSRAVDYPLDETSDLYENVGEDPVLVVNQTALSNILQDLGRGESVKTNMNAISGFQSLLKSRFKQFFAWRDLKNYPKSARFDLVSQIVSPLKIKFTGGEKLTAVGYIDSGVYAQRAGKNWRSVEIKSSFSGTAQFAIQSGKLNFGFTNQSFNSTNRFNPAYERRFDPSKKVSIKYVDQAVRQSAYFQKAQWAIPDIELSMDYKMRATNITRKSPRHFFIEFKKLP